MKNKEYDRGNKWCHTNRGEKMLYILCTYIRCTNFEIKEKKEEESDNKRKT